MSTFDIIHMINTYELAHKNQKISFPLPFTPQKMNKYVKNIYLPEVCQAYSDLIM